MPPSVAVPASADGSGRLGRKRKYDQMPPVASMNTPRVNSTTWTFDCSNAAT
jgi:hypothetical protein